MRKMVALAAGMALIVAVLVSRQRTPVGRRDRRMRRLMNERLTPFVLRRGIPAGPNAGIGVVEHVGRVSGTVRQTLIHPIRLGETFAVPLPYGEAGQWPRNVLAAGHCRLEFRGEVFELANARIGDVSEIDGLPAFDRRIGSLFGGKFLLLDVTSSKPGTLEALETPTLGAPEAGAEAERTSEAGSPAVEPEAVPV